MFADLFRLAVLSLCLTGCATLVAPWSAEPMDQDHGERTFGAVIEDQAIETKVRVNIKRRGEPLSTQRIVVVSFNGHVLLAGQTTSEDLRKQAEELAAAVRHVERVHNELVVVGSSSSLARMNDGWLTFKTKTRLAFTKGVRASRTKVVTENGIVYLLGLMTKAEADLVVKAVQKVYGVQKIVRIIEYID